MTEPSATAASCSSPKLSLWQRVAGWVLFVTVFVALPLAAVTYYSVVRSKAVDQRIIPIVLSLLLLAIPARVAWLAIRRKHRTGSWKMSEDERVALHVHAKKPQSESLQFANAVAYTIFSGILIFIGVERHTHLPQAFFFALAALWIVIAFQAWRRLYGTVHATE